MPYPQVSHMGHARNYLTSDVIRRVLEDYFGYNIHFVMNVTDVDDKIIVKARRAHHLQRFRKSAPPPEEVISGTAAHAQAQGRPLAIPRHLH
jgi:cysteinyl-tRNA synthetase